MNLSERRYAKRFSIIPLLLFAVSSIFLVSCADRSPLRIGFVVTMSGRHSGMGLEERDGVALAVEEINSRGGVNGRKLSVVYEDDRNDPETARKIVSRFIEDEVDVIIGHMTSVMTLSTVDLLEGTDIVMISPRSLSDLRFFAEPRRSEG